MRKNPEALAVFNKIWEAQQYLDSAFIRMSPGQAKELAARASAALEEACWLFEQFAENAGGADKGPFEAKD